MDKTKIRRVFSELFKRTKVAEIDSSKVEISEITRTYNVTTGAMRKWIRKYSLSYQPTVKMVIERFADRTESETLKTQQRAKKVADLERIIGQKQLEMIGRHSASYIPYLKSVPRNLGQTFERFFYQTFDLLSFLKNRQMIAFCAFLKTTRQAHHQAHKRNKEQMLNL